MKCKYGESIPLGDNGGRYANKKAIKLENNDRLVVEIPKLGEPSQNSARSMRGTPYVVYLSSEGKIIKVEPSSVTTVELGRLYKL